MSATTARKPVTHSPDRLYQVLLESICAAANEADED